VTEEVFGVMNFDFKRYDPLNKSDIEMAIAFGLLLGDEIWRLTTAKPPVPSTPPMANATTN
jgi:hypothetical protein